MSRIPVTADLVVIGAGAAGLATAIFCARSAPDLGVVCVDGARRVGAKILVSGGARCNVTNRVVTERDFWGGSPRFVRRVLHAFPASNAAAFFAELGVALHEEEAGKLFPDSNRSRNVLAALLSEAARLGVEIHEGRRVVSVASDVGGFRITCASGASRAGEAGDAGAACWAGGDGEVEYRARAVVLATGGRSLPKSGSDGFGYQLARTLGHGYVETTPALVPLVLRGRDHEALSGISQPAEVAVRVDGRVAVRLDGPLLWTHFGVSGPLALDASRHWHRATLEGRTVELSLSLCPGEPFEAVEAWLMDRRRERPRAFVSTALSARLPAAVADACIGGAGIAPGTTLAHMDREARRALVRALVEAPLAVQGSRGYNYAEVTAGGIPLEEVDPARMASRVCPGLYLVGEVLDVDGRLGGFNFQWAWSSGWVAGHAIARALG